MNMEGLKTMIEEKMEHKQGRPWKIIFKSRVFEEADLERKKILEDMPECEVKVKFLNSQDMFAVKLREPEEQKASKKKKKS